MGGARNQEEPCIVSFPRNKYSVYCPPKQKEVASSSVLLNARFPRGFSMKEGEGGIWLEVRTTAVVGGR